jgi:hypothetical protein
MTAPFSTPVLLLIFNRPDTTQQVFNQIKAIKPLSLYVAGDGPRPGRPDDLILCKQTREIISQIDWNCEVRTLFRDENLGCGLGVCSAISWFFEQVDEGIILEDDCLPDISFFPFCSELLDKFKDDESIYVISGTNLQNGIKRGNSSYFFLYYPITWGWASWSRAWKHFKYDIPNMEEITDSEVFNNVFPNHSEKIFWKNRFKQLETEKKNIWDYQWFFSIWKKNGLSISPNINLINNIGFRNNGSHTFLYDSIREPSKTITMEFPLIHPAKKIDFEADRYIYNNAFSHSLTRMTRIIRENGIFSTLKYILSKYRKQKTKKNDKNS